MSDPDVTEIHAILRERERFDAERDRRLEERFETQEKSLALQAKEYERRLHDLNGEYKRDRERQKDYVTIEKFEAQIRSDADKVELALLRVNEKFDDYIRRYELRQREIDQALAISKGANEQAQRFAEEAARRANRNIAIATLVLGVLVALANWIPSI